MKKTAGILYQSGFKASADYAKTYLTKKNYRVLLSRFFPDFTSISTIPRSPKKLDFLAWYSHGGWDGPMLFDLTGKILFQVSPSESKEWAQLKGYFKSQVKPKAVTLHAMETMGTLFKNLIN